MSDIVNEEIGSYYNKVDPHFAELGRRLQKVAKTMKDEERANMVAITGTELQNYEGDFNKLLKNLETVGVGQEQLKVWLEKASDIIFYRWNQYFGAYKGNHEHRELSRKEKEKYFFPYQ